MQERERQTGAVCSATCTAIWPAGTLAYRCRTCQTNDNCAICKECFQVGDHLQHDYSMYFSDAGGCCDCGDSAAWKPSGFCQRHSGQGTQEPLTLEPLETVTLEAVLSWAVCQLCCALKACVHEFGSPNAKEIAAQVMQWIQDLCKVPVLRFQASKSMLQTRNGLQSALDRAATCCGLHARLELSAPSFYATGMVFTPDMNTALDYVIKKYCLLPEAVMQEVTTFLLQLLFEPSFKKGFLPVLLDNYCELLVEWTLTPPAAGVPLDMITVQLFNDSDAIEQPERLMTVLMSTLFSVMTATLAAGQITAAAIISKKTYGRVLGDIKMVLTHPPAIAALLLHDMPLLLNKVLGLVSNIRSYQRQLGMHIQWQDDSWLHPIQLEALLFHNTLLPLLAGVLDGRLASMPLTQLTQLLRTMTNTLVWVPNSAPDRGCFRQHCGGCGIWNRLLIGGHVSMHIPAQRAVALAYKALLGLHGQAVAAGNDADTQVIGDVLRNMPGSAQVQVGLDTRQQTVELYQALAQPALTIQAWRAQVQAGLWVRNGPEIGQAHRLYQGPFWNEGSHDLDLLLLQIWMAHSDSDDVLVDFLRAFGGERLVQAASGETILDTCPALNGTEADPHSALALAQDNAGMYPWPGDDETASSTTPQGFPSSAAGHGIGTVDIRAGDVAMPPKARPAIDKPYQMAQEEWDLLGPDAQPIQQQQVQCLLQGMRLLVTLLTDQHTWQPGVERQLRWHLVHWLCRQDSTYTELQSALPSQLASQHEAIDKVLAEVASFVTPNTFHRGHYSLRQELWVEFDPHFPYYTPGARQTAIDRGLESKLWKPHQQLRWQVEGLPPGMEGLQAFIHTDLGIDVIRHCLTYCLRHHSTAADDLALAALNLLALSVPAEVSAESSPQAEALSAKLGHAWLQCDAGGMPHNITVYSQLQALFGPNAAHHSLELQDTAQHLHQHLLHHKQGQGLDVLPQGLHPAPSDTPTAPTVQGPGPVTADDKKDGGPSTSSENVSSAGDEAAARKARAKARQAAMMAKMKQQQSQFRDGASADKAETAGADQDEEMVNADEQQPTPVSLDTLGGQDAGLGRGAGASGRQAAEGGGLVPGECAFCGSGNETEPLGWVAQMHCSAIPSFAQTPPPAWQTTPLSPSGLQICPREVGLSIMDEQAGPHVLCCGHMLHESCLARHRLALVQQEEEDEFQEGTDLVDLQDKEFLCPVCRRLGNTLLPALTPPCLPPQSQLSPSNLSHSQEQLSPSPHSAGPTAAVADPQADMPLKTNLQQLVSTVQALTQSQQPQQAVTKLQSDSESEAMLNRPLQIEIGLWGRQHAMASKFVQSAEVFLMLKTLDELRRYAEKEGEADQKAQDPQPAAPQEQGVGSSAAASTMSHLPGMRAMRTVLGQRYDALFMDQMIASEPALLWSTWAWNIVMWEVQHRPHTAHPEAEAASRAQWRGMRSLAALCLAYGPGVSDPPPASPPSPTLDRQLQWLIGDDHSEAPWMGVSDPNLISLVPLAHRACPPAAPSPRGTRPSSQVPGSQSAEEEQPRGLPQQARAPPVQADLSLVPQNALQPPLGFGVDPTETDAMLVQPHSVSMTEEQPSGQQQELTYEAARATARQRNSRAAWPQLLRDPFGLLVHLFASGLAPQHSCHVQACSGAPEGQAVTSPWDVGAASHKPAALLQALTQLVYNIIVLQAAVAMDCTIMPPETGSHDVKDILESDAASVQLTLAPHLLPFVRRARVLRHQVMDESWSAEGQGPVQHRAEYTEQSASMQAADKQQHSATDELNVLLHELSLQPPTAVLQVLLPQPSFPTLYHRWVTLPGIEASHASSQPSLGQGLGLGQFQPGPRLMQLPTMFQDLFLHLAQAECAQCGRPPKEPCLCLQCGAFMCAGDPKCRHPTGEGLCKPHATACGGGTCAFLLLRMTKVLLLSASRACLSPSPYLDDHGEEDVNLTRGRPLYLNQVRWHRLNAVWAAGAVDFDSPTFHAAFGGSAGRAAHFW